jgi:allantoate deiminase
VEPLGGAERAGRAIERLGLLEQEGFAVSHDAAGNLYGRLAGSDPGAPEIWSGSHLDTVPDGGDFDGALGVVAALEAIASLASAEHRATLCVVAFRDEEGWRFGNGCFGSRAICDALTPDELAIEDADGISIGAALDELGLHERSFAVPLPGAYVELHVEQGPVLARADRPLGLVTAIAGMDGYSVEFAGEAGHAGTVPMAGRRDAFAAAAAFSLALYEAARALPGAVATIGTVRLANPATNVVPGRVRLSADVRAPDAAGLASLCAAVEQLAQREAVAAGCTVTTTATGGGPPTPMSPRVRAAISAVAAIEGVPLAELPSGAGHDAAILARAGVDSGMIFVRSLNGGVSHRPEELSSESDIQHAIELLAGTLATLQEGGR